MYGINNEFRCNQRRVAMQEHENRQYVNNNITKISNRIVHEIWIR
jgi:hypothetical protein